MKQAAAGWWWRRADERLQCHDDPSCSGRGMQQTSQTSTDSDVSCRLFQVVIADTAVTDSWLIYSQSTVSIYTCGAVRYGILVDELWN